MLLLFFAYWRVGQKHHTQFGGFLLAGKFEVYVPGKKNLKNKTKPKQTWKVPLPQQIIFFKTSLVTPEHSDCRP